MLAACKRQLLDVDHPRVDEFDVARCQVRRLVCCCLGFTKDRHPAVRSLGAIVGLSVPLKERVVSVDKRALGYQQVYCHVDDDRPTTAAPPGGAVATPAPDADANANANTDVDAGAAPPSPLLPPPLLVSNAIFAVPSPRLSLRRCRTLPLTPPPPLNPVFIVHRHHLVLRDTILCHVGNIFCLKLQQM